MARESETKGIQMNWEDKFNSGLEYDDFLERYGKENDIKRWKGVDEQVELSEDQKTLLNSFKREMNVLCLTGAWCGDCVNQCPVLKHIADGSQNIHLCFLDRDDHADVQEELMMNAGQRVPIVVFLSEDFCEVSRYGERTLSRYRELASQNLGPTCPTGIIPPASDMLKTVTQEWLNEFERAQLVLRLSPRLREIHGN